MWRLSRVIVGGSGVDTRDKDGTRWTAENKSSCMSIEVMARLSAVSKDSLAVSGLEFPISLPAVANDQWW
jgi:hypothetical protein